MGFTKFVTGAEKAVILESKAWEILRSYAGDCAALDAGSLYAVYAIGSLGGGYYRPGQSDIDAVLIVQDAPNSYLLSGLEPSDELVRLNWFYARKYAVPKDFAPFPLPVSKLLPPYDPAEELAPEIARLKLQGVCVWGSFDLDKIPMPSPEDARLYVQHFEVWWRDEYSKIRSIESLTAVECLNTILMHLQRFLWIERGLIEFNKLKLINAYLANDPPFNDQSAFDIVEYYLAAGKVSEAETACLRQCLPLLRDVINSNMGILLSR
jgi:hypothetical protein